MLKADRVAVWRRRIGAVSAALGVLLFAGACFFYLRYAGSSDSHVQERLEHARILGLFWSVSFYGSTVLFLSSLFGVGWGRWVGLIVNGGALFFTLATLGAMCGPFGC